MENETQLKTILDNMVDIVAVFDMSGIIRFVTPSVKGILGYAIDDVMGANVFDYIHSDDRERIRQSFIKAMEMGRQENSLRIRHADGHYLWIEGTGHPIIESGSVTGVVSGFRDITQRKQTEDALRASELRYKSVFENTGTIMLIIEEDMTISFANDRFVKLTGYEREEIEGKKKWTEFIEKADLDRMVQQHKLRRLDKGLAMASYEFRLVHRDGHIRDVYVTVDILPGTLKSVASLIDITERKRMEKSLRENEAKYRTLIETTNTGYVIIDREGKVLDANPEYVYLTGHHDLKEILGRNVMEWTADNQKEKNAEAVRKCFQEGYIRNLEIDYKDYKGKVTPIEINATLMEEEETPYILTLCRDITERKRTEQAMRVSEEKYRQLFELESDAIFLIDNKTGLILEANSAASEMYGYSREELLTKRNTDLSAEQEETRRITEETPVVFDQVVNISLRFHRKKDGTVFPVEITGRLFIWQERPVHIAAIRNITERKQVEDERQRLEERLMRAEKMEALGMMAGGVAHDLNNVLGILVGYSELLLSKLDKSSPLKSYIVNIMQGGERAAALVQDLLTMTRRGVSVRKVVNLNQAINEFLKSPEFLRLSSRYPYVDIKTALEGDLLNISASPAHMTKSIMGLVSNAMETLPDGGTVTIRTMSRYLDKPISGYDDIKEGDYAVVSVSDTGEGISAHDMKRIFEPFYTKRMMGRSGTGLGRRQGSWWIY